MRKNKPGPKPKFGETANRQLNIALTPAMATRLEVIAALANLAPNEYARQVLIEALMKPSELEADREIQA